MADIPIYESTGETVVTATTNGQTVFAFDFLLFRAEQMRVFHRRGTVETELTYPAQFSVSGFNQPNGGSISLVGVSILVNDIIVMRRDTPIERLNDWQNEGDYKADLVNREQDTMFMIMQELRRGEMEVSIDITGLKETDRVLGAAISQEEKERIAGDKAVASLIGQAGPIETQVYDSQMAAALSEVKPEIQSIRTGGFYSAGDGGDALYKRLSVEPSHAGKFQSADGAWWEIIPATDGSVRDLQFGLFDDPSLAFDQSPAWTAFIGYGGKLVSTAGNTYYIPTANNVTPSRNTRIVGSDRGRYTKLVGSGSLVSERIVGGNNLFQPVYGFGVSDLEFELFNSVINGTNNIPVEEISVTYCYAHDCAYYHFGTINCDRYIVEDNLFEDFTDGLVLEAASTIRQKQTFRRNRCRRTVRYIWRIQADAPLFFEENDIFEHTAGVFEGTNGVARIIMRGSRTVTWIKNNRIEKIVAADGNPNLIYWTNGNLFVQDNVFGSATGGTGGGFFIDEKSTNPKNVVVTNNKFIKTDGVGISNGIVERLTLTGDISSTIISGNEIEELNGYLLWGLNNTFAVGVGTPRKMIVANNVIHKLNNASLVLITHGADDVLIEGNTIYNFTNARKAAPITGTELRKALAIITCSSSTPVQAKNIRVQQNAVHFSHEEEESPYDGAIILLNISVNAESTISAIVESNTVSGAKSYAIARANVGKSKLILRRNVTLDGVEVDTNGANNGDDLAFYLTEGNVSLAD